MRGDKVRTTSDHCTWENIPVAAASLDDERGEKVQQVALLGKVEMTAAKRQRTLLRRDRSIEGYVGAK